MLMYMSFGVIYEALPERERRAFKKVMLNPKERITLTLSKLREEMVKGKTQLDESTLVATTNRSRGNTHGNRATGRGYNRNYGNQANQSTQNHGQGTCQGYVRG